MGDYWDSQFRNHALGGTACLLVRKDDGPCGYVTANSEFYRNHLKNFTESMSSFDALTDMPQMTKDHVREGPIGDQSKNLPLGSIQVAKTEDIVQVISSSGTTGRPVYYGITRRDLESWQDALANFTYTAGIRKEDVVAHVVGPRFLRAESRTSEV